jgi:6-pyruvoyl-tetrahydropterin synthase
MVMDFAHLDRAVDNGVVSLLDHAVLVSRKDTALIDAMKILGTKSVTIDGESTAENMVVQIWDLLERHIKEKGLILHRITLWETDKSSVIYEGEHAR